MRRVETDGDAVHITTVHSAKGLEYPVVLVPFAYTERPAASRPYVFNDGGGRVVDVASWVAWGDGADEGGKEALAAAAERKRLAKVEVDGDCVTSALRRPHPRQAPPRRSGGRRRVAPGRRRSVACCSIAGVPVPCSTRRSATPTSAPTRPPRASRSMPSWLRRTARSPASTSRSSSPCAHRCRCSPRRRACSPWPTPACRHPLADPARRTWSFTAITAGLASSPPDRATVAPVAGGYDELPPSDAAASQVRGRLERATRCRTAGGPAAGQRTRRHDVRHRRPRGPRDGRLHVADARRRRRRACRRGVAAVRADARRAGDDHRSRGRRRHAARRAVRRIARCADLRGGRPPRRAGVRPLVRVRPGRRSRHRQGAGDDPRPRRPAARVRPRTWPRRWRSPNSPGGSPGRSTPCSASAPLITRFVVVDYKSNRLHRRDAVDPLAAYRPDVLVEAMTHSHYPLQAVLYCVALHRYLRWRLGSGYDPDRQLGGVAYLFVRGMIGADTPTVDGRPYGVFSWQPPARTVLDARRPVPWRESPLMLTVPTERRRRSSRGSTPGCSDRPRCTPRRWSSELRRTGARTPIVVVLAFALALWAPQHGHSCIDLDTIAELVAAELATDLADRDEVAASIVSAPLPWPPLSRWLDRVARRARRYARCRRSTRSPCSTNDHSCCSDIGCTPNASGSTSAPSPSAIRRRARRRVAPTMSTTVLDCLLPPIVDGVANPQNIAANMVAEGLLTIIVGGPGTGKTHTLANLLAAELAGSTDVRICLAAPTGKAASRLTEAVVATAARGVSTGDLDAGVAARLAGLQATTVHRLLGGRPDVRTRFRHDADNLLDADLIVVDETSMIALPLIARLLAALPDDLPARPRRRSRSVAQHRGRHRARRPRRRWSTRWVARRRRRPAGQPTPHRGGLADRAARRVDPPRRRRRRRRSAARRG